MIVDFSRLDLKRRQILVLENLDGSVIQPLLHVVGGKAKLNFNEISELSFSIPSEDAGSPVTGYNSIGGMRAINWINVGRFLLVEPEVVYNGEIPIKKCKAYSLEYELTYKTFHLEEKSYNLAEIFNLIFESAPSWSLGSVDMSVMTVPRHFSNKSYNVYEFLKNTAQELYNCVFDFDTYNRKVHVLDASKVVAQQPIFISTQNLAKEITVKEQTEELFTAFNVTGADGVDIRAVNPSGENVIYNLDHYMTDEYFSQSMIDKWIAWKTACEDNRETYYLLTIDLILQQNRLATEQAALLLLEAELKNLHIEQAASAQAAAANPNNTLLQEELERDTNNYAAKNAEVAGQQSLCNQIQEQIDALILSQKKINTKCSFDTYFNETELILLDRYIRIADLNEPAFAYKEVVSYVDDDMSAAGVGISLQVLGAELTRIKMGTNGKYITHGHGGNLSATVHSSSDVPLKGILTDIVFEEPGDGSAIITAELSSGTYGSTTFEGACLTVLINKTVDLTASDFTVDNNLGEGHATGTSFTVKTNPVGSKVVTFYLTQTQTEYSKRTVEWNLLEYAETEIRKSAWPRYKFSVSSANFLTADGFEDFKNQFKLGTRNYIEIEGVLTPIAIGAEIEFDDPSSLLLHYGDEYSSFDSEFQLVDILGQTVSSAKSYEASKGAYGEFIASGARDKLADFVNGPVDLSLNEIKSSSDQAFQMDGAGFKLRKYMNKETNTYDPKQIWMTHNSIVFTSDSWQTAEMAIGEITHPLTGAKTCGVAAPALIGNILAGNSVFIRSATEYGGISDFIVDGSGARLYNARFDIVSQDTVEAGHISLNPNVGLVGGIEGVVPIFGYNEDGTYGVFTQRGEIVTRLDTCVDPDNLPRPNFWIDMYGNTYLRGFIYATDGVFSGALKAATIEAATINGTLTGGENGKIVGVSIDIGDGNFTVDSKGNVVMDGGITLGGDITWKTPPLVSKYSPTADGAWDDIMNDDDYWRKDSYDGGKTWCDPYQFRGKNGESAKLPDYIEDTHISSIEIKSPEITGNNIRALKAFEIGDEDGYMGYAKGSTGSVTTYGVAISDGGFKNGCIDADTTGVNYLIVTNAGVRMQSSDGANIYVSGSGGAEDGAAYIEVGSTTYKFQADGIYVNGTKVI